MPFACQRGPINVLESLANFYIIERKKKKPLWLNHIEKCNSERNALYNKLNNKESEIGNSERWDVHTGLTRCDNILHIFIQRGNMKFAVQVPQLNCISNLA
jgi:hypothetical protein